MPDMTPGSSPPSTEQLARQLAAVRDQYASLPDEQRIARVRETLEKMLASTGERQADTLLEGLQQHLVEQARTRERRLTEMEHQLRELSPRAREAAALAERVTQLEQQLRQEREQREGLQGASEEVAKLTEANAQLERQLRQEREQREGLQGASEEVAKLTEANALLERQLRQEREQREGLQSASEQVAKLTEEKARLEQQLRQEREQREGLQSAGERAAALAETNASLERQLQQEREQRVALEGRVAELQAAARAPLATPPPPPPQPSTEPAGSGLRPTLLQAMREGLRKTADGSHVDAAALDLPDDVARLYQLMQELLLFALELDRGVQAFLMELQVGPGMSTVQVKSYHKQVQKRFCDCLDNVGGSIGELRKLLERNRRFLILLNEAYRTAIPVGARDLLAQLDPEKVLAQTRGKGLLKLTNYEGAFKELAGVHQDLAGLPPSEILTRFFTEAFQDELRRQL